MLAYPIPIAGLTGLLIELRNCIDVSTVTWAIALRGNSANFLFLLGSEIVLGIDDRFVAIGPALKPVDREHYPGGYFLTAQVLWHHYE